MPAPPPRPPEMVPVEIDGPLAAVQRSWQLRPPQDSLVIIVRAVCRLVPGGKVELVDDPALPTGDLHHDDDPLASLRHASDFAPFKPQADVLMLGHAYAQRGQRGITRVELRCGPVRRAVAAIGDRSWRAGAPSAPTPFERIPLRWERAFGGAGHPANPVGMGVGGDRLPNLENPEQLIRAPRDRPQPVCFAPLDAAWPARRGQLGTYDAEWLAQRWPYFPADFDWGYFNAAPPEQRCDYLRGDERFELVGVQPDGSIVAGQLPGLRPHLFAQRTAAAGGELRPVEPHLDTVTFDADGLEVALVWRGLLDVSAEQAPELERLFVCLAELNRPLSVEAAAARLDALLAARYGVPSAGGAAGTVTELEASSPLHGEVPTPEAAAARQPPVLSREDVQLLVDSQDVLDGLSLAGCDLTELDLRGRSMRGCYLHDADLGGARLDGADLSGALLVRATAPGASCRGVVLRGANLSEARLPDVDLREADLEGASLNEIAAPRARFDGARLAMAQLTDAELDGCSFDGATAAHADLSGASLEGATFVGAQLDDARLYDVAAGGARFDEASMAGLRADGARLTAASMQRIAAKGASFEAADLTGVELREAVLDRSVFSHANLESARLSRACCVGARFRHARLVGVLAFEANFMEANFENAQLTNADLRGANLYAAETWKAALSGVQLDGALTAASKLAT